MGKKEKEIKTYGDLAEELLECTNDIYKSLIAKNTNTLAKKNERLKVLMAKYGGDNIAYVESRLDAIGYHSRTLADVSDTTSGYFFSKRILLIKEEIEELNKIMLALEKEIEE